MPSGIYLGNKGRIAWNKGLKGFQVSWNKGLKTGNKLLGKHWKIKDTSKMSLSKMGEKHWRWIKDRTKIKRQTERNNPNDKQWKYQVYKRDYFKCKINNNSCSGRIEAHHILSWKDYPELRFNINNGITLCQFHHPRKRKDELRLIPKFRKLVGSKEQ